MLLAGLNDSLGDSVVLDGLTVEEGVTVAYIVMPVLELNVVVSLGVLVTVS
jgi:hypothetical protein